MTKKYSILERKIHKYTLKYYESISYINQKFNLNLKETDNFPYFGLLDKYIIIDKC